MSQKLKVIFAKTGSSRFISHLDLVRLFQRAPRRASLPVVITQGFSPRLKISIAKALKLGMESVSEEATFHMSIPVRPEDFMRSMNEKLPDGVNIIKAEEIK